MGNEERLLRGAEMLGRLWKGDFRRCESGWSPMCSCERRSDFCQAKELWIRLALEDGRQIDEFSPMAIIEAMKVSEIKAAGLTLSVQFPSGTVDVGPTSGMNWDTLLQNMGHPDDLVSVFRVLSIFKGSRVATQEEINEVSKA